MAAFTGANSNEWSGPGNPLGQAQFWIYQNGKPVNSLATAFLTGQDFTVAWYYSPSNAEIDNGITSRQMIAEVFTTKSSYFKILGTMYSLRRDRADQPDPFKYPKGTTLF